MLHSRQLLLWSCTILTVILSVPVSAYNRCWFFGDEFCNRSFEKFYKSRPSSEYNSYVKANFNVMGYYNSGFVTDNPSLISRMCNLMVNAVSRKQTNNKLLPLPKLIVIVMDDDIIKLFSCEAKGLSKAFNRILNCIMTEYERCIAAFKDYLPAKSFNSEFPHILWIHAPMHDNFDNNSARFKYNKCLEEVAKMHSNVFTLPLKKVQNPHDGNLYLEHAKRFSSDGYRDYWEAIDHTVRYCDSIVLKKLERQKLQKFTPGAIFTGCSFGQKDRFQGDQKGQNCQKDRNNDNCFRWKNPTYNLSSPATVWQLPPPP